MINAWLNHFFLFIDNVADWFGWSKIAILSYFLSSDFVSIVIITAKKKSKEWAIVETNPEIKKDNCGTQDEVNSTKAPPADRKTLALIARETPADRDALALVNGKIPVDKDALAD